MHRVVAAFVAVLLLVASPAFARANELADVTLPRLRPIRFASLEVNPLAVLVGRFGGQAQVGVYGPIALSVGMSRVSLSDNQKVIADNIYGNPSVEGWSFEVGGRLYVPIERNTSRVDVFVAPAYAHDALRQGDVRYCDPYCSGHSSGHDLTRDGLVVDIGLQVTTAPGFYVLGGIGHQWFFGSGLASRSSSDSVLSWEDPQRGEKRPRLLLALGWTI